MRSMVSLTVVAWNLDSIMSFAMANVNLLLMRPMAKCNGRNRCIDIVNYICQFICVEVLLPVKYTTTNTV